jgi:hypothetical protein
MGQSHEARDTTRNEGNIAGQAWKPHFRAGPNKRRTRQERFDHEGHICTFLASIERDKSLKDAKLYSSKYPNKNYICE